MRNRQTLRRLSRPRKSRTARLLGYFSAKKLRVLARAAVRPFKSAKKLIMKLASSRSVGFRRITASVLAFALLFSSVFYAVMPQKALGQTYELVQNDWSGGVESSQPALAPNSLSGYGKYASVSNVDAGNGSLGLSLQNGSVSESFDSTANKDITNTTASWDGTGQISRPGYAHTDWTGSFTGRGMPAAGLSYDGRTFVAVSSKKAYFLYNQQLFRYELQTQQAFDITSDSGLSSISSYSGGLYGIAFDGLNLYVALGCWSLVKIDIATDAATEVTNGRIIGCSGLAADPVRHLVYQLSGSNFGVYNSVANSETDLTSSSGISSYVGSDGPSFAVDQNDGKVYFLGSSSFAAYDPATGLASGLVTSSGIGGLWASRDIRSLIYSGSDKKMYFAGWTGSATLFGSYDPATGGASDLASGSGLTDWPAIAAAFVPGGKIFFAGRKIYAYDIASGQFSEIDTSFLSNPILNALMVDETTSTLYAAGIRYSGGDINTVLSYAIPCVSCSAVSAALDSTPQDVVSASLTKNDAPGTGTIGYQLSNDGGAHWESVTPGSPHAFSSKGSDLRFKITLTGDASVQDISVAYGYYPAAGELVSSKFDGVDPTTVVNRLAWNEGSLPAGTSVVAALRTAATAAGLDSAQWVNLRNGEPSAAGATVTENFSANDNKDSVQTTANWGPSGLSMPGYVDHDLSSAAAAAGVTGWNYGSPPLYEPQSRLVYITTSNSKLFTYNPANDSFADITASSGYGTVAALYGTAPQIQAIDNGKIYFRANCGDMAVLDVATGLIAQAPSGVLITTCPHLAADSVRHLIYQWGYEGLAVWNPADNSVRMLTGIFGSWLYGDVDVDQATGKVFFKNNAAVGVYDPATGQAKVISESSGLSSLAPARDVSYLDMIGGKLYLNGRNNTKDSELSAVYTPGDPGSLQDISGLNSIKNWWRATQFVGSGLPGRILGTDAYALSDISEDKQLSPSFANGSRDHRMGIGYDPDHSMMMAYGFYLDDNSPLFGTLKVPCQECSAVSTKLNSGSQGILSAMLSKNDAPGAGTVSYQLSNDGGSHWEDAVPGLLHVFSSTGSDLRFKAVLTGDATVQDISVTYYSAVSGSASCAKASGTVSCGPSTMPASFQDGSGDRFFQYKLTLVSDGAATPTVSSAAVQFVVNAPPELRNVTASQNSDGTVTIGYEVRDPDTAGGSPGNVGFVTPSFEYWDGSAYHAASALASGDLNRKSVDMDGTTWRAYSATWSPATDFPGHYLPNAVKVRVTVSDGEGANPTASAETAVFGLDTKAPTGAAPINVAVESGPWSSAWSGVATASLHITTSAASYVLVGVAANRTDGSADEQVTSVTGPGLSFAKLAGGAIPGYAADNAEYWGAYSSSALSDAAITATLSNPSNIGMSVISLSNVLAINPVGTVIGATSRTGDLSASFGSTSIGSMVFAAAFSREYDWNSLTPSSGTTLYAHTNVAQFIRSTGAVTGSSAVISSVGWSPSTTAEYAGVEIKSELGNTPLVSADASGASPVVHLSSADDSPLFMRVSKTDATLASTASEAYSASKSMSLAAGDTIYARFIDAFANSTAVISATVPATPAAVMIQDTTNLRSSPPVYQLFLAWKASSASDFASYRIYRSTDQGAAFPWTLISTRTNAADNYFMDASVSAGTDYYYYVVTADANGDLSPRSAIVNGKADGKQDAGEGGGGVLGPSISNVSSGTPTVSGAVITWDTDALSDSTVEYGLASGSYTNSVADATLRNTAAGVGAHSVAITGLAPSTAYRFRVKSSDVAGGLATDDNSGSGYSFTTAADTTPPVITSVSVNLVSDVSAVISWTTDEPADSRVGYSTDLSYSGGATSAGFDTAHLVTLTGLTASTAYRFRVISADTHGNSATDDNSGAGYAFTTAQGPGQTVTVRARSQETDTIAPMVLNLRVSSITKTSASVEWNTDEAADTVVKYGQTIAYGSLAGSVDEKVMAHQVSLSGLEPGTIYHLIAVSADAAGNQGTSSDRQFATLRQDGTAVPLPNQPEQGNANIGANDNANGNANANEPTGRDLEPVIGPSDKIMGALSDMLKDPDLSNLPEQPFIATVNEIIDRVVKPPSIVGLTPNAEVSGTTAKISWKTDKKATGTVAYASSADYLPDRPEPYGAIVSAPGDLVSSHEVIIDNLRPATVYHFQVRSRGLVGGEAKSADAIFQTAADLPVISGLKVLAVNDRDATVAWSTNVPTSTEIRFKDLATGKELTQGDTSFLRDHKFKLEKLQSGVAYAFVVEAADESGNRVSSGTVPLVTSKDDQPPQISKVASNSTLYPGEKAKVQTIITWTTDEPSTSSVFYQEGLGKDAQEIEIPADPALVTQHTVVVTKFRPMTVYKFRVESADAAGNVGKSNEFLVLTPQQKASVLDVIIGNFEQVFGWTKKLK